MFYIFSIVGFMLFFSTACSDSLLKEHRQKYEKKYEQKDEYAKLLKQNSSHKAVRDAHKAVELANQDVHYFVLQKKYGFLLTCIIQVLSKIYCPQCPEYIKKYNPLQGLKPSSSSQNIPQKNIEFEQRTSFCNEKLKILNKKIKLDLEENCRIAELSDEVLQILKDEESLQDRIELTNEGCDTSEYVDLAEKYGYLPRLDFPKLLDRLT